MADWDKRAIERDRRFLVRLVVFLGLGLLAGALLLMSTQRIGGCAAETFEQAAGDDPGSQ